LFDEKTALIGGSFFGGGEGHKIWGGNITKIDHEEYTVTVKKCALFGGDQVRRRTISLSADAVCSTPWAAVLTEVEDMLGNMGVLLDVVRQYWEKIGKER
jgi:hydrogenase maturation factor HypF (carbamoyltransferase family)